MTLNHSFSVEHATKYGMECAILIYHFQFWIEQNRRLKRNFYEGKTWTYQTQAEIAAIYPYMGEDKVFRIIKRLIDLGILVKANFNKTKFDQTTWYAFANEEMFTIPQICGMDSADPRNQFRRSAEPIPDTTSLPKEDIEKDNVKEQTVKDKTVPFSTQKGGKQEQDLSKRFKLTESQLESLKWLKSLNLSTQEPTLCYWAKKHPLQRLKDVYKAAKNGRNPGALMNQLLIDKTRVMDDNAEYNKLAAESFKKEMDWNALKILQKYAAVKFPNGYEAEIPYDLQKFEFMEHLVSAFTQTKR